MGRLFLPAAALALLSCSSALAQAAGASSIDLRYCQAMSQLDMRYVGNPESEPRSIRRADVTADNAIAQCRQGNVADAIPVLERKLADNRITLPSRE